MATRRPAWKCLLHRIMDSFEPLVVLVQVEPVGMVLVAPGLDTEWVLLLALVGHGEHFLALLIAHELSEFFHVGLSLVDGLQKGGIHDVGC